MAQPRTEGPGSSVNMELLRLFDRVAALGGIAPAARALNLEASVATRKIARLEKALDVRLFDRTTRSIKLTESGGIALAWAQQALAGYESAADNLAALKSRPSGTIRIAINQTVGVRHFPGLVTRFCEQNPSIDLTIALTDNALKLLGEGYDLAVHSGPPPDKHLVAKRLVEFQRVLLASPGYLKKHGMPARPEDLARHDCLVHRTNDTDIWHFMRGTVQLAQKVKARVEADSQEMLLALANQGLGIVRTGRLIAGEEIGAGRMVQVLADYKAVNPTGEHPSVWLVYPGKPVPFRTRALIEFLVSEWKGFAHKNIARERQKRKLAKT